MVDNSNVKFTAQMTVTQQNKALAQYLFNQTVPKKYQACSNDLVISVNKAATRTRNNQNNSSLQ